MEGDLGSEPLILLEKTKTFPNFLESTWHTPSDTYLTCTILQTEVFASTQKKKKGRLNRPNKALIREP